MEQTLEVQATISVLIPEDKILVDKVEYQELKEKDFDGWVGMDVFIKKSNRSRTTIKNLLNRPEMVKKLSIENGGWVFYPADAGKWSFHYKEMMDFINKEFYQKFSGGSGL
ncbi:DUF771 domain-containing protein [Lactococcus lactis]|uniref:Prophage protein n=1 Tax=Lactococcus lactis subsp. lactis TaxID=1360 RepID=A0A1V0NDX5_LACLL|nr:DUF771 domain-containing protein [Lactococcus lactis]ARD98116.1 prophage protein [Lactococcus lactis subsp. lactis]